jgi:diguanylate cyclase (GGDEF)-like protein
VSESPTAAAGPVAEAADIACIRQALNAVGEAAYHWDITTDKLTWSANAAGVLGVEKTELIATGRGYASLLDPDNFTSRFEAVMRTSLRDEGAGVSYQIEYLFRPRGRADEASSWLEDAGRWHAGTDGRPLHAAGVVRQIRGRHHSDPHVRMVGNGDPLTGMMNRSRMAGALGEAMDTALRDGTSCAFLVATISNLAVVNDAYGYDIADEVIIAVGRRLRQVVRTGDAIGRYSGAKFGLILANCDDRDLEIASERFLSVARESVIDTDRGPVWAMLSIGGLVLPKYADAPGLAMARAEEALAAARRLPTDGFVAFRPSAERVSVRGFNARCAAEIVAGLKEDRFTLGYQPIVDARTGETALHEAVLHLIPAKDEGEAIAAADLIPVAEKLGLVRLIDRRVMMLAVQRLQRFPNARLSLNVSGITATDPRWYGQLTEILSEQREINDRLTVEITETVALNDLNETARFIAALHELGCSVAIDDFGAGYTSFRNIKMLNIDIVKLDGSFCADLAGNQDNQYFVRSLIELAHKFELKTVAEWVESEEDANLLRSWGVDYLQGELFGEVTLEAPWPESARDETAFAAGQAEEARPNLSLEQHSAPASEWAVDAPPETTTAEAADDHWAAEAAVPPSNNNVMAGLDGETVGQDLTEEAAEPRDPMASPPQSATPDAAKAYDLDLSRLRAAAAALNTKRASPVERDAPVTDLHVPPGTGLGDKLAAILGKRNAASP